MDAAIQKKLDRIKQLIGMAGSSNQEEARTMAFLACKMIREGNFEILPPPEPVVSPRARRSGVGEPAPDAGVHVASPFRRRSSAPRSAVFSEEELERIMKDVFGSSYSTGSVSASGGFWEQRQTGATMACNRCGIRIPAGSLAWIWNERARMMSTIVRCVGCRPV